VPPLAALRRLHGTRRLRPGPPLRDRLQDGDEEGELAERVEPGEEGPVREGTEERDERELRREERQERHLGEAPVRVVWDDAEREDGDADRDEQVDGREAEPGGRPRGAPGDDLRGKSMDEDP